MEEPIHTRLEDVIVNAIQEDVAGGTGSRCKGRPLPEVVLGIEAEVDHNDGRHAHDNHEDGINAQEEPVDVVVLVVPKRGEDVVQLNEN